MADNYAVSSGSPTNAAFWGLGSVPSTGDTAVLDGRVTGDVTGVNQSTILLSSLRLTMSNSYNVGGPSAMWQIGATLCRIGDAPDDGSSGSGSQTIALDLGTNASTCTVIGSRSGGASGLATVMLKGTNASNALYVEGGNVGLGTALPGQTASFPTISVTGGQLTIGSGVTAPTTLNVSGQNTKVVGNVSGTGWTQTTTTLNGGTLRLEGGVLVGGTIVVNSGATLVPNNRAASGSSLGTVRLRGGTLDLSQDPRAITIDTLDFQSGTIKLAQTNQLTNTNLLQTVSNKTITKSQS